MKHFSFIIMIFSFTLIIEGCLNQRNVLGYKSNQRNDIDLSKCPENADTSYNRLEVFKFLSESLNNSVPEYKELVEKGFYIDENGKAIGFFVFDLTDTTNKYTSLNHCINFINNHIYHFCPILNTFSYSSILILKDHNYKIFKSINCPARGDSIESVTSYITDKLENNSQKEEILNRVKDYRRYGHYIKIDDQTIFHCE